MRNPTTTTLRTDQENDLLLWQAFPDICANYHNGNPESVKANRRVDKLGQTKRILEAFKWLKHASCEDIERITNLPHQSANARISELKRDGRIVKSGTGKTKSGCSCALYSSNET